MVSGVVVRWEVLLSLPEEMIRPFLPGAGCSPPHLPKAGVLDTASVALRHEPLPAPARHLPHDVVIHDAGLSAPEHPSLQDDVGRRHVNTDVRHLVEHSLESVSHLVNGDDKRLEERLEKAAHRLFGLLVHTL
jgi:hypothetical protein